MGIIWAPESQNGAFMSCLSVLVFGASKKERKCYQKSSKKVHFGSSPEGVRRVHSCTIAQFPLFRPCPFWLHFWLHFGVILGAKFATILLFGAPDRQKGPQQNMSFVYIFLRPSQRPSGGVALKYHLQGWAQGGGRGKGYPSFEGLKD